MTPTTNPTIGDQGATTGTATAIPAGWHRDPLGRFPLRYWDGTTWTENVVNPQRQVGIDVAWARDAEAARAGARTPTPAPGRPGPQPTAPAVAQAQPPTATPARPETPTQADLRRTPPDPSDSRGDGVLPAMPDVPAVPHVPDAPHPRAVPAPVTSAAEASAPEPHPPVERFDISPEAVMGRRAARATSPAATTSASAPARRAGAATAAAPVAASPTDATEPSPAGPSAVRRALTTLGRIPGLITSGWVATGFAVVAVFAVVAMGLSWASSSRSYAAQEAWQDRAEAWEDRAGEHADERDEAIAQVGQTRRRNRTLTEDIAELEDQIEGLAADNASLQDENRLLRDALADLGYRLAP